MKATMSQTADDGMDALYGQAEGDKSPTKTVDQEIEKENAAQATVPLKVLMGKHTEPLKVGDEVVLKVDKIDGEQAIVSYSETKPSEIGKEGDDKPPTGEMSADEELDSMDKAGGY